MSSMLNMTIMERILEQSWMSLVIILAGRTCNVSIPMIVRKVELVSILVNEYLGVTQNQNTYIGMIVRNVLDW